MPVRIRLKRMGAPKKPFYRIVVMDVRVARGGRSIEELGYYDPRAEALKVDGDRAKHWLGVGAQPTPTVVTLLRRSGVIASAPGYQPKPDKPVDKKSAKAAAAEAAAAPAETPVAVETVTEEASASSPEGGE